MLLAAELKFRARRYTEAADLLQTLVAAKFISRADYNRILKKKDILCYIPVPDQLRRVQDRMRVDVAKDLLKRGIISKTVHDKIT